jgi:hypothetical protein
LVRLGRNRSHHRCVFLERVVDSVCVIIRDVIPDLDRYLAAELCIQHAATPPLVAWTKLTGTVSGTVTRTLHNPLLVSD